MGFLDGADYVEVEMVIDEAIGIMRDNEKTSVSNTFGAELRSE